MAFTAVTRKKTQEESDPRSRQIDELQRISAERRSQFLGQDWFRTIRILYNLLQGAASRPSFRPAVLIPQLQTLMFNEATDLSSLSPKVYITRQHNQRDKDREKSFQDYWRWQNVNNRLLFAELWALYAGTSFLQVGYDPESLHGSGKVWVDWLDPENVYPDPSARNDENDQNGWTYVISETRLYVDQVKKLFPETAVDLKARPSSGSPTLNLVGESAGYSFEMPPGPLSFTPGPSPGAQRQSWDGKVRLRWAWTLDYSVVETKESNVDKALKSLEDSSRVKPIKARFKPKYPDGRFLVECEGKILADGNNPFPVTPLSRFPIVALWSLPNLTAFWAPPPPRFSLDLQELASRMFAQVYENAARLNNGVWFIDESTGIDAEDFGGLPGEVRVINSGSKIPEVKWPSPMPAHMVELPKLLLNYQKELLGFTQERQGQPGQGNISSGLFDASLYQSQFLTRLRSMLLAESVQKLAEMMFYTMSRYFKHSRYFPAFHRQDEFGDQDAALSEWTKTDDENYQIFLDPGSVRPISQTALRQLVMSLRGAGLIDAQDALEALEIPDAEEKAGKVERENLIAALAKLKRR